MAHRPATTRIRFGVAALVASLLFVADRSPAQTPTIAGSPTLVSMDGPSSAYPNGSFSEQLSSASQGGGGPVGGSKYRPGSGRRDDWKVGPHWRATVDGVLLFRDGSNLDAILAEVEAPDPGELPAPGTPLEFRDNFDHAAGVRVLLTSEFPQCSGYELQVGYVGVEQWMANAYYAQEEIVAPVLPMPGVPSEPGVQQRRLVGYESSLHSAELNFQRETDGYLKPFAGVRYFGLDESINDQNQQFTTGVLGDPAAVGNMLSSATTQTRNGVDVQNNLIGFHGGLRLDMWQPTRKLHFNGFVSAGVYCNIVDRDRVFEETNAVTTRERVEDATTMVESINTTTSTSNTRSVVSADGTRIAFATEASLAGTWRLSNSMALRGGYQVLFLQGVELAENLWTAPPPITAVEDDLFLHGWFAGFEYRR